jgi:polyhydroxyalkanoate synthesis regulator phasin
MIKVKESKNLFRDPSTNAIINKGISERESYIARRKELKSKNERIEFLEKEVNSMKNMMETILKKLEEK